MKDENNFEEKRKHELKAIRGYIEALREIYDKVIEESFQKSKKEVQMLFEILNSWADTIPLFQIYTLDEIIHTIPGVVFMYLWRAGNWIIYEILTGHYFEAFRDIRFLFEGSLLAIHYDYYIDRKVYEKWGSLGTFDLKAEIVELAEKLRDQTRGRKPRSYLIRNNVKAFIDKSRLSEEEKILRSLL